jgi:transposase-like protein
VVASRPGYLAIGIDCDGVKQALGVWVGPTAGESAKFWLSVLSDLKSRGVADVCIVCCDGLAGLPDAITVTWPRPHWEQFTPFLVFPPEVRRVTYTTHLIESMNARLRKVTVTAVSSPPSRPPSRSSTSRSATWRSSAAPTWASAAPGGSKRSSVHHLLRRPDPDPMRTATLTYTDGGRSHPPIGAGAGACGEGRMAGCSAMVWRPVVVDGLRAISG